MGKNTTSARAEDVDVTSKPRRRRRDGYFWQLVILRIPVAVLAVVAIAYLAQYIHRWEGATSRPRDGPLATRKDAQQQSGLALSMASVSLVVAVWEAVSRVVPPYKLGPRPLGPLTIFFDLLVIGLGIPGWLYFSMAEYRTEPGFPTSWRRDQDQAATMIIVFWALHCIMCIVGCSACCRCCGSGSASSAKAAVKPALVHAAQRRDLEEAVASEAATSEALSSEALSSEALTSQAPTSQTITPQPLTSEALPNYKYSTGLEEVEPIAVSTDPPSYPDAVRLPHYTSK